MGFDADWLALRAPADDRARDARLLAAARELAAARADALIVDLGCGSGASVRALGLAGARWRLVDNDPALLSRAGAVAQERGLSAELMVLDLAAPGAGLGQTVAGADLVVASAFLDLVSASWVDRLVDALPPQAALYVALSYSGEMRWTPDLAQDEAVRAAFNQHQLRDKGFGPALGPKAADVLAARLTAAGRTPSLARSDWRLTAEQDGALIAELTSGVAGAAAEMGLETREWGAARRAARAGVVSHLDLFAPPAA